MGTSSFFMSKITSSGLYPYFYLYTQCFEITQIDLKEKQIETSHISSKIF